MTENGELRYVAALDGIRAVAIGLVVVAHIWFRFEVGGIAGVSMFFVLSGYLITMLLLREHTRTGSIRLWQFYWRRALRLYPALLTLLAVLLVASLFVEIPFIAHYAVFAGAYTSNLWMTVHHDWMEPLTHTWSLAQEEQFYLVWPPVLLLALQRGLTRRTLIVALLLGATASFAFDLLTSHGYTKSPHFDPLGRSHGMLLGCALAVLVPRPRQGVAAMGASAVPVGLVLGVIHAVPYPVAALLVEVGTVSIIAIVTTKTARPSLQVSRMLASKPAIHLGKISYALYLWHWPLLRLMHSAPLAVGLAVAAAEASTWLVEKPFRALRHRQSKSRQGHEASM